MERSHKILYINLASQVEMSIIAKNEFDGNPDYFLLILRTQSAALLIVIYTVSEMPNSNHQTWVFTNPTGYSSNILCWSEATHTVSIVHITITCPNSSCSFSPVSLLPAEKVLYDDPKNTLVLHHLCSGFKQFHCVVEACSILFKI